MNPIQVSLRNPCQRMQDYAFYYAFSVTLFVLIVIEHALNAFAALLVRLIWGNAQVVLHTIASEFGSDPAYVDT